jgi:hypothetical protein
MLSTSGGLYVDVYLVITFPSKPRLMTPDDVVGFDTPLMLLKSSINHH